MPANRTSNYIATIPMKNEEQVLEVKKVLEQIFGWVTLRGRHTDRKKVLGITWSKNRQNDIPWRKAQYIDIYLHHANPNRQRIWNKQGMQRNNLKLNDTNVITARVLGTIGHSLADGVKHTQQSKQNSSPLQAIYDLQYQTQMKDPVFQRKEMKRKYQNKSYTLQPGDWGYKTQAMLDFVERYRSVSFSELKEYYDVILCGNPNMVDGGSFIHHLHSLVNWMNAKNRRCGRYLTKNTDGKYSITNYK